MERFVNEYQGRDNIYKAIYLAQITIYVMKNKKKTVGVKSKSYHNVCNL